MIVFTRQLWTKDQVRNEDRSVFKRNWSEHYLISTLNLFSAPKLRLFWSSWRIEKYFGDCVSSLSCKFGDLCLTVVMQAVK